MNPVQSDSHHAGGLRSIRGGHANAVKEHVFMRRFLHLMFNTESAAAWINERITRLLRASELQLDEVPLEGLDERVNQCVGGGALRTQDREHVVDRR